MVVTIYLKGGSKWGWLVSFLPAVFMFVVSAWAAVENQVNFGSKHNLLLQVLNLIIIISMIWVAVEGIIIFFKTPYSPTLMEEEMKDAA